MNLLIDIGNQRIKWLMEGALSNAQVVPHALDHALLDWDDQLRAAFMRMPEPAGVFVSSVAAAGVVERLKMLVDDIWGLQLVVVKVHANKSSFDVEYRPLDALGVDRYLAMLGAAFASRRSCVVVNAGTAVTLDYVQRHLKGYRFAGGMIMPGLKILQNSLAKRTAQISGCSGNVHLPVELNNYSTHECVAAGVNAMYFYAVSSVLERYAQSKCPPFVVLSGGDAPVLYAALTDAKVYPADLLRVDAALVLRGINRLIAEGGCAG